MRPKLTIADHLRMLELGTNATADQVRAAFRRLALQWHPDLSRHGGSRQRFIEIVEAYRALQMEMSLRPNMAHYRVCPRCTHWAELLPGLDGQPACPACLLGERQRRRTLPMPALVTVRHLGTIALYLISFVLLVQYCQHPAPWAAAMSLLCTACGLLLLFVACMEVPTVC